MMNRPIALFDSGVGGLTVLKAVAELLPREDLIYLGDTARVPYGTKGTDTIVRYTLNAADKLMELGAKMLIIACNTATSAALPEVAKKFAPIPVLGVVEPGARAAVNASKNKRIAVLATEATIKGRAYQNALARLQPGIRVICQPCTLFVALAEEGWSNGAIAEAVARKYLEHIFAKNNKISFPDTLLLGCTHFPLFKTVLERIVGPEIKIVDSALATALTVKKELEKLNLAGNGKGKRIFYTTDNPERFISSGSLFLDEALQMDEVTLIDL